MKPETEKGGGGRKKKEKNSQVFRTLIPNGRKWDEWSQFHQNVLKYTALHVALHRKYAFTPHTIFIEVKRN